MKIITCITRLIRGGAQRLALETAARLAAAGHEAPLWCGPETGPEGSLHEEAAARGVPVRIFPHLRRAVRPHDDLRACHDLTRALRTERPDIFHTHSSKAGILGREAAHRAGVARVIHTVHGWGFTPRTSPWMNAAFVMLERRLAPRGPMVFVNAEDRREGLRRGIRPHPQSRVIPPGIDLEPFSDRQHLRRAGLETRRSVGIPDKAVVGGFLGRLSAQKGPDVMLEVAQATAGLESRVQWLVVGDGPLAGALHARAAAAPSLDGRVHWAGLQPDPARWLAAMDFLILPSRWEGTPLTIMEAMVAGLPIIASDLPGVRWVLQGLPPGDGDPALTGGLLAPCDDVTSFSASVAWLAADAGARARLGAAARALAIPRFGLESMFEALLALYLEDASAEPC